MTDIRAVENRIRLQYTKAKFEGDEQKAKAMANHLKLIWKIILGKKTK